MLIDLAWSTVIWAGSSFVLAVVALAGLVKAVKDIRKDGWEPFKERWIRPIRARRQERRMLKELVKSTQETCESLGAKVNEILKEVKPNGGESLKDRIINIDNKVENIVACKRHEDETSDRAIFKLDNNGEMTFANSAFRELVNAEDPQLEHNNYLSLIETDDRRRFIRSRAEAIELKMPLDAIVKFKLQGPHYVTVRMVASPDVRHGGVLKGFFGTASAVTGDS